MLLFVTNLAGILFASEVVFLVHGYGSFRRGALGILVTLLASAALTYPLGGSMRSMYSRSEAMMIAQTMLAEQRHAGVETGRIFDMSVFYDSEDMLTVKAKGVAPVGRASHLQERVTSFQERLERSLGEPVRVNIEAMIVPIERFTIEPSSDT
ncbi:MAG: hypothetical protein DHS20C15_13270 [Planctomycetota bacterium]|nr:MAG: hypothetical protein DHS20C15_13270 [Planctomycetota bacterium]